MQWASPTAFGGYVLGGNQSSACIPNYRDLLNSGGLYTILMPAPSGSVLVLEFSDSACQNLTSATLGGASDLASRAPSPFSSNYTLSVVAAPPPSILSRVSS